MRIAPCSTADANGLGLNSGVRPSTTPHSYIQSDFQASSSFNVGFPTLRYSVMFGSLVLALFLPSFIVYSGMSGIATFLEAYELLKFYKILNYLSQTPF